MAKLQFTTTDEDEIRVIAEMTGRSLPFRRDSGWWEATAVRHSSRGLTVWAATADPPRCSKRRGGCVMASKDTLQRIALRLDAMVTRLYEIQTAASLYADAEAMPTAADLDAFEAAIGAGNPRYTVASLGEVEQAGEVEQWAVWDETTNLPPPDSRAFESEEEAKREADRLNAINREERARLGDASERGEEA